MGILPETTAGKRKTLYISPESPHTAASRKKATQQMERFLEERGERVVKGGDDRLNDLRLAFLTWCQRQVKADDRTAVSGLFGPSFERIDGPKQESS